MDTVELEERFYKYNSWSFTKYQLWNKCRRAYYYSYIAPALKDSTELDSKKVKELKNNLVSRRTLQGKLVHEVIEQQINQIQLFGKIDETGLKNQYSERVEQFRNKAKNKIVEFYNGGQLDDSFFDRIMGDGLDQIKMFTGVIWPQIKDLEYLQHEKFDKFHIGNVGVTVKVDYACRSKDGGLLLLDWKTGSIDGGQNNELQIASYILWGTEKYGCDPGLVQGGLVHLTNGLIKPYAFTMSQLEAIRLSISKSFKEMNENYDINNFNPSPNLHTCLSCQFYVICDPSKPEYWAAKSFELWDRNGFYPFDTSKINMDNYEKAVKCYNNAIALDPSCTGWYYGKARVCTALSFCAKDMGFQGKFDLYFYETLETYKRAIKIDPSDVRFWIEIGDFFNEFGKHDEAGNAFDKAIEINQDDEWFHYHIWDGKIGALKGLAKTNPQDADLWCALGNAWCKRRMNPSDVVSEYNALQAYDKAIMNRPDFVEAWYRKGFALKKYSNNDAEAEAAFATAIRLNPNDAKIWHYKGLAYAQGKQDEAIKDFDEAIRLDPNLAGAWYNKGEVLRDLGKHDDAIKAYEEAIRLSRYCQGNIFAKASDNKVAALKANALGHTSIKQLSLPHSQEEAKSKNWWQFWR